MTMKVILVSDLHLGYENSDKTAFNRFLDSLKQDTKATDLVLLGDIVDMWRRDSSGVFLENHDIFEKIVLLSKKMNVHYVAGNHDYHVLKLQNHKYPFNFKPILPLRDGQFHYKFLHGYEYEIPPQNVQVYEALCRVMSDEIGDFESDLWSTFARGWSNFRSFFSTLFLKKRKIQETAKKVRVNAETRLSTTLTQIEQNVCSQVQDHEIIVFGHTHHAFVSTSGNVANTGSWVTDSQVHNTYVELSNGKPRLFIFEGNEIT